MPLKIAIPNPATTTLAVIDLQSKLLPAMAKRDRLINRCQMLINGISALNGRIIVSEQYPKGLGGTVPEIQSVLPEKTPIVSKTAFSVFGEAQFRRELAGTATLSLIFCGVEAHVCVLQSAIDAANAGYDVLLAADAVDSRKDFDCSLALEELRSRGITVLSAEAILFMLLKNAAAPEFKTVSKLVK